MLPRISLGIDNCFASKRWTRPADWMQLIKDMGLNLVEASADTECDPLYMGAEYTADWIKEVQECSARYGVQVANLYSGHGTYVTLGLAHTHPHVRERFRDGWLKEQANTARSLGAGLGFFAHAVNDATLQCTSQYKDTMDTLYDDLANLASYASDIGLSSIGVEQMYAPHQPPWTLSSAQDMLVNVVQRSGKPFYLTLDLGHMNGQQYFNRPTGGQVAQWIERAKKGERLRKLWLGSAAARRLFADAVKGQLTVLSAVSQIESDMEQHPHLFSLPEDGSLSKWVQTFGCYSPIIHLQQSDGVSSPHWPFSTEWNNKGIVKAPDVLRDIAKAYENPPEKGLPPKCEHIVLTLEPFISTAGNSYDAVEDIVASVEYWRSFVPKDGMTLEEILALL